MDLVWLLKAALGVLAFWLLAALPAGLAWAIARRRRMPPEARRSFITVCLLASHGAALVVLAMLAPLSILYVEYLAAGARAPEVPAWAWRVGACLDYGALGATLLAGALTAIVLPLKLSRVWPSMRAAARMHAAPQVDPAERHE